jgi:hypothetical protein
LVELAINVFEVVAGDRRKRLPLAGGGKRPRVEHRLSQRARNEGLLREVNERIEEIDKAQEDKGTAAVLEFLCECGSAGGCDQVVEMTIPEYEDVRSQDDRFAVCPGHELDELEKVVKRSDRFLVVDKRPAAEPLVADDPRGAPSS